MHRIESIFKRTGRSSLTEGRRGEGGGGGGGRGGEERGGGGGRGKENVF